MSANFPTADLIITTYNWPQALKLVLKSVRNQTIQPQHIIIADDGSTNETKELIDHFQENLTIKLTHAWQEDLGFRAAMSRNNAISKADSDYVIIVDGDTILHPNFIKDHLSMAAKGRFLIGSRVLLNELKTKSIQDKQQIYISSLSSGIKNRLNAMNIPLLRNVIFKLNTNISKARSCNMSFWKSDFMKVNGFNEDMTGWGREDAELCARFVNLGLLKGHIKFGAVQYHQYHPENSRHKLNINDQILQKTIDQKLIRCTNGIDKYLD